MQSEENIWIAIYTKARHEKQVQKQLQSIGIEAYVPLKREYHRWSDRCKLVEVPLIPSYVFAHVNPTSYLKIFTVFGIVEVVNFHGRAAIIRDEEIKLLKKAEIINNVTLIPSNEFKANEEVEIVSGIFAGYRGKVVRCDYNCKVGISIEPIEYSLVVDVEIKDVRILVKELVN